MSRELTFKQKEFVKEYIIDGNGTRAVREAYPNIKTEKARAVMATRLIRNDNVRDAIDKALADKGITPEVVMGKFQTIGESAKYDRDKISAWRNIAEMAGFMKKEPAVVIGQQAFFVDEEQRQMESDARRVVTEFEEEQKQSVVSLSENKQVGSSTEKIINTQEDSLLPIKTNAHVEGADCPADDSMGLC